MTALRKRSASAPPCSEVGMSGKPDSFKSVGTSSMTPSWLNAASKATCRIGSSARRSDAWPSQVGGRSSHGVSANTEAKSGATNADHRSGLVSRGGADGSCAASAIRRTRVAAVCGRYRARRPCRKSSPALGIVGDARENHSCSASTPETAMAGGGRPRSDWTPVQTEESSAHPPGGLSSNTRTRTPWAAAGAASCAALAPKPYRRSSSNCNGFMPTC
ncbi:hypothetical protein SAMN05444747_1144 [Variovorax sp. OV329]|nr:hypothetical protein SAMN05444747_1144 [Variovorax sp. OV329]